jgi:hypothetical protein
MERAPKVNYVVLHWRALCQFDNKFGDLDCVVDGMGMGIASAPGVSCTAQTSRAM